MTQLYYTIQIITAINNTIEESPKTLFDDIIDIFYYDPYPSHQDIQTLKQALILFNKQNIINEELTYEIPINIFDSILLAVQYQIKKTKSKQLINYKNELVRLYYLKFNT
jgi:subtilase family serine protease